MGKRSIMITGCSSGIGLHAAEYLHQHGWQVFACARKPQDVEKLAEKGLYAVRLDMDDPASIRQAVSMISNKTGGTLDALFNNAGILIAGAVEDLTNDMMAQQFSTNVFGPMQLTREVLPMMRKQGHGRIIQNSSILGVVTLPYYGAYNASKFALEGFSLSLRQELMNTNIHVSIINPGPIQSTLRKNAHDTYQETIAKDQSGHHADDYKRLEKDYFTPGSTSHKLQLHPQAVTNKLMHALTSRHPKIHYYVGWSAQLLVILKWFLPERLFYWLFSKVRG